MIMRWLLMLALLWGSTSWAIDDKAQEALRTHEEHLENEDYPKALLSLNQALRFQREMSVEGQALLLEKTGDFYRLYTSELDKARKNLLRATRLRGLDPDSEVKKRTEEKLELVDALQEKYQEEAAFLAEVKRWPSDELEARVGELHAELEQIDPECPHLPSLYYFLGDGYLKRKEYRSAFNVFEKSRVLAPAIFFRHPLAPKQQTAFEMWSKTVFPVVFTILQAIALLVLVVLFFASKPMQWIRWGHLVLLPLLLLVWHGAFHVIFQANGELVSQDISVPFWPGALRSEGLASLYSYGVVMSVLLYIVALLASRIPFAPTRIFASLAGAMVLLSLLMGTFGFRHGQASFEIAPGERFQLLLGNFSYTSNDPLPYALADPKSYPGMRMENLDEQFLRDFFDDLGYSADREVPHE